MESLGLDEVEGEDAQIRRCRWQWEIEEETRALNARIT